MTAVVLIGQGEHHVRAAEISPNPLQTMWFHPRETIRWIIDTNPNRNVFVLALASGIAAYLPQLTSIDKASSWNWLAVPIAGSLYGLMGVFVMAPILYWVGGWVGGLSSPVELRAVLAWSALPTIATLIPKFLMLFGFYAWRLNSGTAAMADSNSALQMLGSINWIAGGIASFWVFVLQIAATSEALGTNRIRAFFALIIANLLFLPLYLLFIGIVDFIFA